MLAQVSFFEALTRKDSFSRAEAKFICDEYSKSRNLKSIQSSPNPRDSLTKGLDSCIFTGGGGTGAETGAGTIAGGGGTGFGAGVAIEVSEGGGGIRVGPGDPEFGASKKVRSIRPGTFNGSEGGATDCFSGNGGIDFIVLMYSVRIRILFLFNSEISILVRLMEVSNFPKIIFFGRFFDG